MRAYTLNKNLVITLFFFLLITSSGLSQRKFRYDSLYVCDSGLEGKATFDYYLDNDKIMKTGKFSFNAEIPDYNCPTHLIREEWSGAYRKNLKNKEWNYSVREYNVDISNISRKEIDYNVLLEESAFTVNYDNGKLDDKFIYERFLLKNDQKQKQLEKLVLTFSNHKVNGEIYYENKENDNFLTITGKAYKGLMEGKWVFNNKKTKEKEVRFYKKGVLTRLVKLNQKDTTLSLNYPLSDEIQKVLNGENTDFELANKPLSLLFSDGYPRNSEFLEAQKDNNTHLERFLELIFHFEPSINIKFGLVLGTNRGYYPLKNDEKEYLKSWPDTEYNYRKSIKNANVLLLTNRRYKSDSLMQVLSAWEKKQKILLDKIGPWNQILFKDQLEFYNRKGLVMDYAQSIISSDTINLHDTTYIFDYSGDSELGDNFLSYLVGIINNRTEFANDLFSQVDQRLGKLYLEDEVDTKNKDIINGRISLDSLYKNTEFKYDLTKYSQKIGNYYLTPYFEEKYTSFISETSVVKQNELGNELETDFEILTEIHAEIKTIENRQHFIDSLYTEYSFDPFTYSDRVPTRVKKKLYDIVAEDMFYKLFDKIDPKHSDLTTVLKQLNTITELQKRLIFLRDKDTGKIERKLKSEKSIQNRLEILQIQ